MARIYESLVKDWLAIRGEVIIQLHEAGLFPSASARMVEYDVQCPASLTASIVAAILLVGQRTN